MNNPFIVNTLFKIGVGFAGTEVIIAINGQTSAKFQFTQSANANFEAVRAFEVLKEKILQMEVQAVDYMRVSDADWASCERFTKFFN